MPHLPSALRRSVLILPIAALAVTAGCASGPQWTRSSTSEEETLYDLSACRRAADKELADLGYYRGLDTEGSDIDDPIGAADRSAVSSKLNALIAACMEAKGYRRGTR